MDNFITGDLKNIAHLLDHPRFTFHQHDVTESSILKVIWTTSCTLPHRPRLLTI